MMTHAAIVGLISSLVTLATIIGLFAFVGYLALRDVPKDFT
jgi:hypothetical protein